MRFGKQFISLADNRQACIIHITTGGLPVACDGNDQMHGHGGNDYMRGGNGNDLIRGNDGDDNLHGDAGNDNVDGGSGNDRIDGQTEQTALSGGVSKVYSSRAVGNHVGIRHRTPGDDQRPVDVAVVNNSGARYVVYASGRLRVLGGARHRGDLSRIPLVKPIVGMALTLSKNGYWMVAKDGGIFAYGDARFYGTGSQRQFSTAAAIAPNGRHYYILDARGGTLCRGSCP